MNEPRVSELQVVLNGIAFGESPRWHDGRLWFANWGAAQEIRTVDLQGHSDVVAKGPKPAGYSIDWLPNGDLLVTGEGQILRHTGDGSFVTLLFAPGMTPAARRALLVRAKAGHELDPTRVRFARVVEYDITDRGSGDLICLLTTILDPREAPALALAECYHQRWEHEGANKEVKTQLRGPGKILRSQSPDMVRQELYGYLIAHYAVSAMICQAATETGVDPDRVKFTQTVRLVRDTIAGPDGFSP